MYGEAAEAGKALQSDKTRKELLQELLKSKFCRASECREAASNC